RLLHDRLQQTMLASMRSGHHGALLFIDLDRFKQLNDTLGHDYGDLLLQQVAQRLKECVRQADTVARLGGDEFVVLLEELNAEAPVAQEETIAIGQKILASLNRPYDLNGHAHLSTPSIGATIFCGPQNSREELIKQADLAMYRAKSAGRNTLCFFDPAMLEEFFSRAAPLAER
ncbi:MAG: GGDEF domain-containing protein, partial [Hylemonella sp.]